MNIVKTIAFLSLLPSFLFAQIKNTEAEVLTTIPIENGRIVYEKVFMLDSVNDRDKVFNSAKAALIKNVNYKYGKIDEDRVSGSISTQISFMFSAKPGVARINLAGKGLLTVDARENRFRVRISNNTAENPGLLILFDMPETLNREILMANQDKWKAEKSVIMPWDSHLRQIIDAFGVLISQNVSDDFQPTP